jgi:hypothetical protein
MARQRRRRGSKDPAANARGSAAGCPPVDCPAPPGRAWPVLSALEVRADRRALAKPYSASTPTRKAPPPSLLVLVSFAPRVLWDFRGTPVVPQSPMHRKRHWPRPRLGFMSTSSFDPRTPARPSRPQEGAPGAPCGSRPECARRSDHGGSDRALSGSPRQPVATARSSPVALRPACPPLPRSPMHGTVAPPAHRTPTCPEGRAPAAR